MQLLGRCNDNEFKDAHEAITLLSHNWVKHEDYHIHPPRETNHHKQSARQLFLGASGFTHEPLKLPRLPTGEGRAPKKSTFAQMGQPPSPICCNGALRPSGSSTLTAPCLSQRPSSKSQNAAPMPQDEAKLTQQSWASRCQYSVRAHCCDCRGLCPLPHTHSQC